MEMLLLSTLFLCVDWGQTKDIANYRDVYETNPILGKNPSQSKVNWYFASVISVNAAVGYALPEKYRKYFWGSVAITEASVALHNKSIGLTIRF